ncbi:Fungal specific transcription factor domain [Ceratobasidium sp. AG-Ba]|nr:Fungal specific transcription factor domain [Ceratobasidium sp. AG-Ba]
MASSAVPAKRRGHHATKACNGCRRRRCRCDGVHPVCGTCSFYGHECTWSQEEDARRPATKQLVESLRVRIRELETELSQTRASSEGLGQHENIASASTSTNPAHTAQLRIKTEDEHPNKSSLMVHEGSISASGPTSMWSTFPTDESKQEEHKNDVLGPMYQFVFRTDPSVPSHLQPREVQLSEMCRWDLHLPKLDFELTRFEHDTILDRFFNFYSLWLRVVVHESFLRDMLVVLVPDHIHPSNGQPARTLSYSPFLHCAILSVAALFSDNPLVKSRETRGRFASYAKQHLESECERPTLAAVQALSLLSDYHASCGERGVAYLFAGMSCRMTRALGLCIDSKIWVEKKLMTHTELIHRDWQFWSTFCQDKIMSLDYGRDFDIPLPHLGVGMPVVDTSMDQSPWTGDPHSPVEIEKHQPNNATLVFFETSKLMLIALRIMNTVYSQGRQNWKVTEKDSVSDIHLVLETWYNNLPEDLLVSSRSSARPTPHVIVLNIAYWWLLMLLHRPFYARTQRPASHASTEQPPTSFMDLSVKFCDRAATKIVQLITLFDQSHGMKYYPLNMLQAIFMAGTTLLVQAATLSGLAVKKRMDAHEATRKCIYALRAASQTWESANLSASRLEQLLQEQTGALPIIEGFNPQQLQTSSTTSSPLNRQPPLPENPYAVPGSYSTNSPSQVLPRMFRDFIAQQDPNSELGYTLSAQVPPLQYPELQELHQQPLMGMPSGSQFATNPHMLPLPYDPNFNAAYHSIEDHEEVYYQHQHQH